MFTSDETIEIIWGSIRSLLVTEFTFGEIKEITGLAGLDLTKISHLQQMLRGGASKSQLMTGIDRVFEACQK